MGVLQTFDGAKRRVASDKKLLKFEIHTQLNNIWTKYAHFIGSSSKSILSTIVCVLSIFLPHFNKISVIRAKFALPRVQSVSVCFMIDWPNSIGNVSSPN